MYILANREAARGKAVLGDGHVGAFRERHRVAMAIKERGKNSFIHRYNWMHSTRSVRRVKDWSVDRGHSQHRPGENGKRRIAKRLYENIRWERRYG